MRRQIGFIPGTIPEEEDRYVGTWVFLNREKGEPLSGLVKAVQKGIIILNPHQTAKVKGEKIDYLLKEEDLIVSRSEVSFITPSTRQEIEASCNYFKKCNCK